MFPDRLASQVDMKCTLGSVELSCDGDQNRAAGWKCPSAGAGKGPGDWWATLNDVAARKLARLPSIYRLPPAVLVLTVLRVNSLKPPAYGQ